jgi:hypothetical protein
LHQRRQADDAARAGFQASKASKADLMNALPSDLAAAFAAFKAETSGEVLGSSPGQVLLPAGPALPPDLAAAFVAFKAGDHPRDDCGGCQRIFGF